MSLRRRSRQAQGLALIVSFAAVLAVAGIGGAVTGDSVDGWYAGLVKPTFNPPNSIFAPMWTALYILMAIAAWRVWNRRSPAGGKALTVYGMQLALNLAWSLIFFALHRPDLALACIIALLAAIVTCIIAFRRIDPPAALLLLPYLAWTTFAAVLNTAIWRLN